MALAGCAHDPMSRKVSLGQIEPIEAMATLPDNGLMIAFPSRLERRAVDGRQLATFEFAAEANVRFDGLATDGQFVWGSGFFSGPIKIASGKIGPRGAFDGFIAQWDASTLQLRWFLQLGTGGMTMARRLALASDGTAWVVGTVEQRLGVTPDEPLAIGDGDAFALNVNVAGAPLRVIRFGGKGQDIARGVAIAGDGTVAIVGMFGGPTRERPTGARDTNHDLVIGNHRLKHLGNADGFVVLLRANGEVKAVTSIAEPGFDVVKDVLPTPEGWLVGGSVKLDAGDGGQPGGAEHLRGFIAWLDHDGVVQRQERKQNLLTMHKLVSAHGAWWGTGHAIADERREMVLLRIDLQNSIEVARCRSPDGMALGHVISAATSVYFGGVGALPLSCSGAVAMSGLPAARLSFH